MTRLDALEEKYQLLHKLAEGGMGAVYKVRHRLLDEPRVVKVVNRMHADNEGARLRFEQEARAATKLRHPHIAQIHDFVIDEQGGAYLVMEYIEGVTLKQLLQSSGPPPVELAVEVAMQSLEALDYLHERGYVHRDVAPDNLMLARGQKNEPLVKLIDLGLAKRPDDRLDLTATNMFVGKVRYSSPEVFRRGKGKASPQSDLYSFGVVFYELLTGACPIQGSSFEELATAHLLEAPLAFDEADPEARIPDGVREVVGRALEKQAKNRPESARTMAASLAPFRRPTGLVLPEAIVPSGGGDPTLGFTDDFPRGGLPRDSQAPTLAAGRATAATPLARIQTTETQARTPAKPRTPPPRRALSARTSRTPWLAVTGLLVVAGLVAGFLWWRGNVQVTPVQPPVVAPAFGRLVIDAVPWARISSVLDAEGRQVPIGDQRETPRLLALPAGEYEIRLQHPDFPASGPILVTVPVAGTARIREQLGSLETDEYFRQTGLYDELMAAGGESP